MHLSPNAVACAMRTKHRGVQDRRARSARYAECANVVCFDLGGRFPPDNQLRAPKDQDNKSHNYKEALHYPFADFFFNKSICDVCTTVLHTPLVRR